MTDKSKFEQMLEKLVADDKTAAEEIFHNIVVEKSRSIYEGLLEDDIKDIEVEETSKEDTSKEETPKKEEWDYEELLNSLELAALKSSEQDINVTQYIRSG